ncbi:MAG: prepilin-type N-terminal cleavage/methylation domain-containing protein [Verrucomicrobiia bacterium]
MKSIHHPSFARPSTYTGKPRMKHGWQKQNTRSATRAWHAPWAELRYLPAEDAPIPCSGIGARACPWTSVFHPWLLVRHPTLSGINAPATQHPSAILVERHPLAAASCHGGPPCRRPWSDLPTEVTEGSPRFRAEREEGRRTEGREAKSSRAKVAKSAKGSRMNRPNTRANQSCRSPYSAFLRREADLELQARDPNTVRPDAQRAAYSVLGSPFAIFATFAREFRSSSVPPAPRGASLRPSGRIPLPASPWVIPVRFLDLPPAVQGLPARRTSIKGFTLIELMTVMSIIIILAGLVVGISSYANRSAIESRTKAEIKAMETALEAYKADYGAYPPLDQNAFTPGATPVPTDGCQINTNFLAGSSVPKSNGWLNVHFVYRALSGVSSNVPKTYMTFTPKQTNAVTIGTATYTVILDPNGNPYGYNPFNPSANPQTYDLWSAGVDGKSSYPTLSSTNDDLGNWQR